MEETRPETRFVTKMSPFVLSASTSNLDRRPTSLSGRCYVFRGLFCFRSSRPCDTGVLDDRDVDLLVPVSHRLDPSWGLLWFPKYEKVYSFDPVSSLGSYVSSNGYRPRI